MSCGAACEHVRLSALEIFLSASLCSCQACQAIYPADSLFARLSSLLLCSERYISMRTVSILFIILASSLSKAVPTSISPHLTERAPALLLPYGWYYLNLKLLDASCPDPTGNKEVEFAMQWTLDAGFGTDHELIIQTNQQLGLEDETWPTVIEPATGLPFALMRVRRAKRARVFKNSRAPFYRCCRFTWIQDIFLWETIDLHVLGDTKVLMTCTDDDVPDDCKQIFDPDPFDCKGRPHIAKVEHII
ncbi:uncharacterized protein L969DRAFT_460269 [Mixia osmundae IAM 14324]|uniref:Uncharacterized protein n=1 Tax=Mixia osmundae (strain CBS 9802 / IAM 14324 / JCM 22182 / KY 12970) TaxID=764103 RepID=G7DVP2_MIXOS|nr:uncharacterized protein L969DRAFT_460269 [Mixia osmundae IAM 14324]KEI39666.1 hypothetical protein L969DRAFT_460269 [Mixia osmundae IAM 14324]GAA94652.1 hypothetical protein E5Q_01305 [Mixia osmundae IAM 14324]